MFDHLMLDLETLSTDTSRGVVLSIAAVPFNETEVSPIVFVSHLDVNSQIGLGRRVDFQTLIWWMRQSPEAIQRAFLGSEERQYPGKSLVALVRFIKDHTTENTVTAWVHGMHFDTPLLRSLMSDYLPSHPNPEIVPYNAWRDVRSFCQGIDRPTVEGVKHDPISDCLAQIKWVQAAWKAGRPQ